MKNKDVEVKQQEVEEATGTEGFSDPGNTAVDEAPKMDNARPLNPPEGSPLWEADRNRLQGQVDYLTNLIQKMAQKQGVNTDNVLLKTGEISDGYVTIPLDYNGKIIKTYKALPGARSFLNEHQIPVDDQFYEVELVDGQKMPPMHYTAFKKMMKGKKMPAVIKDYLVVREGENRKMKYPRQQYGHSELVKVTLGRHEGESIVYDGPEIHVPYGLLNA